MSFREVPVFEIREVLRLWLRGEGLSSVGRFREVATSFGTLTVLEPPDDQVVVRHQPASMKVSPAKNDWRTNGTALLALFGRGPSGKGARTDRRALFQIVTDELIRPAPPLAPTKLRRRLLAKT
jgi:hypothetical protein